MKSYSSLTRQATYANYLPVPSRYLILSPSVATSPRPEIIDPCRPSPCGINAECRDRSGAASCTCLPGLQGDPYVECKPECTINPDCPNTLACVRNKCVDPCPGVCGVHATCSVSNHRPNCLCDPGYVGDPFTACQIRPTSKFLREKDTVDFGRRCIYGEIYYGKIYPLPEGISADFIRGKNVNRGY